MIDWFLFKKLISIFLHFIPGVPLLLLLSLLLRRWLPKLCGVMSILLCMLLVAASFPVVSDRLVSTLEDQGSVLVTAPADTGVILVHGYGHVVSDQLPINSQLYPGALARLTEGVRLWKSKPDSMFALSGRSPLKGVPSHAEKMHEMALVLGVPEEKIIRFDDAQDTEDEINAAVLWLNDKKPGSRLVAVSTAIHLPRSAMLIETHNVNYSLGPTDFIVANTGHNFPSAYALLSVDRVLHEWVGMTWYRLKNLFS